jgi:hypothetical protein
MVRTIYRICSIHFKVDLTTWTCHYSDRLQAERQEFDFRQKKTGYEAFTVTHKGTKASFLESEWSLHAAARAEKCRIWRCCQQQRFSEFRHVRSFLNQRQKWHTLHLRPRPLLFDLSWNASLHLCPVNDGTINILKPSGFFTYHQVVRKETARL